MEEPVGDGRAKRRKTENLQTRSLLQHGASISAVARIAARLRDLPDLEVNRYKLTRASDSLFAQLGRVHALDLVRPEEEFKWEFLDPNRLVAHLVHASPKLAGAFAAAAARHPCSSDRPWHLCMVWDEFMPGNVLSSLNARKTMVLSFSFLELGQDKLWHEECWFSPVLVRSKIIGRAQGGWSGMMRAYLNAHLYSATGIATAGLPLMLNGQPFMLFAKLSHMLADADGHRLAFEWKGAAGIKCCLRHWNVLKLNSDLAGRDQTFVEIDCSDPGRFRLSTASDIAQQVDAILEMRRRVSSGQAPKVRLVQLEKAVGLGSTELGLLADGDLRRRVDLVQTMRYDWMHCALQDGTMAVEATLLLSASGSVGVTSAEIESHLKHDWVFPHCQKAKGSSLHRIFESCSTGMQDSVKAQAGQMMILHGLLRHFFMQRVGRIAAIAPQLKSFCAACSCVDILLAAKRRQLPMDQAATKLQGALQHHMRCHIAAYGKDHLKPKFHYMWDIAEQLARDPFVLDCFVVERLHKRGKRAAQDIENTRRYERSLVTCVLHAHSNALDRESSPEFGLVGRTAPVPSHAGIVVAQGLVCHGVRVHAGDLVFRGDLLGRVSSCCMEGSCLCVLVQQMALVQQLASQNGVWAPVPSPCTVWRAEDLVPAVAWTKSVGNTTVIRV